MFRSSLYRLASQQAKRQLLSRGVNGKVVLSTTSTAFRSVAVVLPSKVSAPTQQQRLFSSVPNELENESFPEFRQLTDLHPGLQSNIASMKIEEMTEIQAKTWESAKTGRDVLARARTGTGKTLAFLLPSLQQIMDQNELPDGIQVLVLSPTRELASQIHNEARKLTRNIGLNHQVLFGGSSRGLDVQKFEQGLPHVLVATPGRLKDHLQSTNVRGVPFRDHVRETRVLVLDETDRYVASIYCSPYFHHLRFLTIVVVIHLFSLLDMGFRDEIEEILRYMPPKEQRQTLLFSATLPQEVRHVMAKTMRPDYETVDCIQDTCPASATNAQVEQTHLILNHKERLFSGTVDTITNLIADAKQSNEDLKMVVFFNTANLVAFYSQLFNRVLRIPVLELHSRKSQTYRTKTADQFRRSKNGILFTSDVSARGVDYPNVTHVVQCGIADSRESYIHRLGRTGRAGKKGKGILILSDLEEGFLDDLAGLDVPRDVELQDSLEEGPSHHVEVAMKGIPANMDMRYSFENAYRSMLGFYNGKLQKFGYRPDDLVGLINAFSEQVGLEQPPAISAKLAKNLGISRVPGVNLDYNQSPRGGRGDGGYGGGNYQRRSVGYGTGGRFGKGGGGRSHDSGRGQGQYGGGGFRGGGDRGGYRDNGYGDSRGFGGEGRNSRYRGGASRKSNEDNDYNW